MQGRITIDSAIQLGRRLPHFTQEQVKIEPMLFRATPEYAKTHGGPITKVHMLMHEGD